jgi:hypothetical protein
MKGESRAGAGRRSDNVVEPLNWPVILIYLLMVSHD